MGASHIPRQGPFRPLTGAALAGTLGVWEKENQKLTHLFNIHNQFCLPSQGVFSLCGTSAYLCLPTNWTGTCTLVYLTPKIDIAQGNQSLPVTIEEQIRYQRALKLIPLLVGVGVTTATGTGRGDLATSLSYYCLLSQDFCDSLEEIAKFILSLQTQIDCLEAVTLQNRRELDLLTAEKGGLCIFLRDKCCFYSNQSGIVQSAAKKLTEKDSEIRHHNGHSSARL